VRPKPLSPPSEVRELAIAEMGARGDALAAGADGPLYVPYALPGERVRARVVGDRGHVEEVLSANPDRVAAPCAHFGRCGGCQLQHWARDPYLSFKREQVIMALQRRGVDALVDPIIEAWGRGRRRAAFHAQKVGRIVRFGFMHRGGSTIEAIKQCPVLVPELEAMLSALEDLGARFAPARGETTIACLASETGLDVAFKGAGKPAALSRAQWEDAARHMETLDLARLSFDGEPLLTRRAPILAMGPARVAPPPGAFVQATQAGEDALGALVLEALRGAEKAADLFSGVGTFALRLAQHCDVLAVEGDDAMLAALKAAADAIGNGRTVTIERRDLLRTPISAMELKRFDAIVFDPPRSGAKLQAEQIAQSKATRVAAVSCDPATFARDVKVLMDAGFKLTRVTPVDQFRWSAHVEVVGALER
jgi:23S rRNA (uracil1939-C5)-methyltransferase